MSEPEECSDPKFHPAMCKCPGFRRPVVEVDSPLPNCSCRWVLADTTNDFWPERIGKDPACPRHRHQFEPPNRKQEQ